MLLSRLAHNGRELEPDLHEEVRGLQLQCKIAMVIRSVEEGLLYEW